MSVDHEPISSPRNPLVREVAGLIDKSRKRRRAGRFVIEGERELLAAVAGGIQLEQVVFCPELLGGNERLHSPESLGEAVGPDVLCVAVAPRVYAKLAVRQDAQGVIAVARTPETALPSLEPGQGALLLVVEGVEKPGNLGALLRTADAAGADGVIVCDPDVDVYNPNVIRASLGAVFTVRVSCGSAKEVRRWLVNHTVKMVVATPGAQTPHWQVDYSGRVAIVLGSEKAGVSREWLKAPANLVRIPMAGQVDSLNLSASGAILLYEAVRQRSGR